MITDIISTDACVCENVWQREVAALRLESMPSLAHFQYLSPLLLLSIAHSTEEKDLILRESTTAKVAKT